MLLLRTENMYTNFLFRKLMKKKILRLVIEMIRIILILMRQVKWVGLMLAIVKILVMLLIII